MRIIKEAKSLQERNVIGRGDSFVVTLSTKTDDYEITVDCNEGEVTDVYSPGMSSNDYWEDFVSVDPILSKQVKMWSDVASLIKMNKMEIQA